MTVAVCAGCEVSQALPEAMRGNAAPVTHQLLVPEIHCINCVRKIEDALNQREDVFHARVNLSRKRVAIAADPAADPSLWIEAIGDLGFEAHEAEDEQAPGDQRKHLLQLGVAGFAMMNVMLLSVAVWSGATDTTREFLHWVAAAIALPATVFSAEPFFTSAWSALRKLRVNMDVPISLAIALAATLSLYETIQGGQHTYYDAALTLTFFLLAGRYLDQRARRLARSAATDLAALEPHRVTRVIAGQSEVVPLAEVNVGDTLRLAAGNRAPVDGRLTEGTAEVDRGALTGESRPIPLHAGQEVIAGDVFLTGPVQIEARTVGADTTLRRMIELASAAEGVRGRYVRLADQAAKIYAPLVHTLALMAFVGWMLARGDLHFAVSVAIATLIITCPCALGLAVPAVVSVASGNLFRRGILVKSDTALERLALVDTVVFDKTGTLTQAALVPPELVESEQSILKALAEGTDHPLAVGLLKELTGVASATLTDIAEHAGKGVEAVHDGRRVRLGSSAWIGTAQGTVLDIDGAVYSLQSSERVRTGAKQLIRKMIDGGLNVHLLTGDRAEQAQRMAQELGVDNVHAELNPEQKLRFIQDVQSSGRKVLMVGDGLNDTLALTEAWASVAPGTALEASRNAADVVILNEDLGAIGDALRIARSARKRIIENFGLSATYNAIAIPAALLGFATPLAAAIAMSTSSITVVLNSLRAR